MLMRIWRSRWYGKRLTMSFSKLSVGSSRRDNHLFLLQRAKLQTSNFSKCSSLRKMRQAIADCLEFIKRSSASSDDMPESYMIDNKTKIYVVSIMKAFSCIGTGIGFGGRLWMSSHDQYVESSKQAISQSGSHDGPLISGTTYGTSAKGDNNMDMDDEENTKSDVFARSVNGGKWEVYPDVTAL
nr:hypothetical protein [Tanacetum cinerariifolium]